MWYKVISSFLENKDVENILDIQSKFIFAIKNGLLRDSECYRIRCWMLLMRDKKILEDLLQDRKKRFFNFRNQFSV